MKQIVVLGGGISGYGSAILAKKKGFGVFLSDAGRIADRYKAKLDEWEVPYEEGGHTEERILAATEVVKSPGIPDTVPMVRKIREAGIPVISEMEFAGRYMGKAKCICITGSNGKTTTTSLIYKIMRDAGMNVALGGNIGESFAWSVATGDYDWYVLELSSFQLDGMYRFRAHVGVLMNITPDHLDRYDHCFQNYADSKMRIVQNMTSRDWFVYSGDDEVIWNEIPKYDLRMRQLPFAAKNAVASGAGDAFLCDGKFTATAGKASVEIDTAKLQIKGLHNAYNAMAAALATLAAGVAPAEAACAQSDSFQVRVRRGELEDYQVSERLSLTLRGQVNGRIGTASTQAVTEESIPLLIQGVLESAALIETDEQDAILPPDDSYSSVCNASQAVTAITAEQKIALARDIDAKLRSDDPRLTPDTCAVATGEETFTLKNTLGLDLSHHSNMIYAMADVVARDGEHAATNYEIRWGYGLDAIDAEELAESCKREALLKLEAGRMKSGAYPVVIKNTAMADLLATFCGVFSADNAQKGLSLLAGREGEAVASASVTLTDDPLMPMGLASCPFDREGAATKTKAVIENGVLKTLLHNRKTAKKAGCRTTGNAAGAGRVAPTNLFFKPGKLTQEELLANLGDGLYLTEVSGLHAGANPISGDFSLLSRGFEIKGGRVVRAVEEFTVAGNFYQLLKDITDVGGDLLFEASPIGSPSVLVKRLDVAGA